jgi:hypothetical protein
MEEQKATSLSTVVQNWPALAALDAIFEQGKAAAPGRS